MTNESNYVDIICAKLKSEFARLSSQFHNSTKDVGVRYAILDDLLPAHMTQRIYDEFPATAAMRLMDSFREKKYTSKEFDSFSPVLKQITFAFQNPAVVRLIEGITGIRDQVPDEHLYAGGLSAMVMDQFLGPHVDNSHDGERARYRTLNLLFYVTPEWKEEYGGNLELWDSDVRRNVTIASKFNRLALMETTPTSWHSVSKVRVDGRRCCVSNYYFSERSPTGAEYFNITSFNGRPEQPFVRALTKIDNKLRSAVRLVFRTGLGRRDIYEGHSR